ncbi:MAG: 2-hydroxyacyl-CoA dehydratase [Candidatus Latescibacteria bacterium]|nr:2-hydroxyacyl-CoA dehydratase [Candidatus Latescibacterota bacterium]
MPRIGITTTVPSEIIWAAGAVPVDLNNIFITSKLRDKYIQKAEYDGYPRNVCSWIKGIYGALSEMNDIQTIVAVTQGDCSNTHALMETLALIGIKTIPFAYPYDRNRKALRREICSLAEKLGTDIGHAETFRKKIEPIRKQLDLLDAMTWNENRVTGAENHLWLVSSSDFNSDYERFAHDLTTFIDEASKRKPISNVLRLGYIGVPPILDDLYDVANDFEAHFVFNEIQRQFSMINRDGDIVDQYHSYTYPYDIFNRIKYIQREINRRRIHGIVHYVQSFCHRHIEDLVVRKKISVPILTIEGEAPGKVDERTKIRLQAFIEMLERHQNM